MPETTVEEKIIRQLEYYFSDINLSKDKFLQEEIQKDAGWVKINVLTTFKRLNDLSSDEKVIIEAIKKSTSDLLQVDEENNRLRRSKPLPEDLTQFETTLKKNTVYVKGFPETLTLDELYSFFEPFGKVLHIYMRRIPSTKTFKGSAFITFETNEQVKEFMAKEDVKYNDTTPLTRETQEAYIERKGPEYEKKVNAKKNKEQEKEDKKKQLAEAEQAYLKSQQIANSVIHLKGFPAEATREDIKELFDTHFKVRWVHYNKGEPEAFVRFLEPDTAKPALEKAKELGKDGDIIVKDTKLEGRVVEGEEEDKFWKDVVKQMTEARMNKKKNHHGSRGNGKSRNGRRDYNNKRSREDEDNENNNNSNDNKNGKNEDDKKENENNDDKAIKKLKVESVPEASSEKKVPVTDSPKETKA